MPLKPAFLLLTLLLGGILPGYGDNELDDLMSGFESDEVPSGNEEIDDLLSGFDEQSTEDNPEVDPKASFLPPWLELKGSNSLWSAVNFAHEAPPPGTPDYRGLSMFRGLGELVADLSIGDWKGRIGGTAFYDSAYELNDQRDLYSDKYLDEYEREVELGEVYLQGSLADNLDLKIGRQIVAWGKSDNLRVTDVLNPLDIRRPGMTDIRYLRLPAAMTRLDYFWGNWSTSIIVVHEPRFSRIPVYNGEFYPGEQPLPPLKEPGWSWNNQQPAISINGIFSGWDISFYGAWVYPFNSHVDPDQAGAPYRTYDKALMAGSAVNIALGNWLLKAEAAYWDGLEYTNTSDEKSRFDLLAGLEYSGFSETTITFEIVNRQIFDYDPLLGNLPDGQEEDTTQCVIRFTQDYFNNSLQLNILLSSYGFLMEDGGYERIQLDYDFNDQVVLTGGLMFYESGQQPGFSGVGDNDKLFMEIKYSF